MTPGILVLNAVITAIAAVIAVLLAQWWTTRRDDRQWQRQRERDSSEREEQRRRDREQREDQRRRDAEQREDQRERDHALWDREDRHRFTDYKRDLYAEYLATEVERAVYSGLIVKLVQKEVQRRERERADPLRDPAEWIESSHAEIWEHCDNRVYIALLEKLSIIGPAPIAHQAGELSRGIGGILDCALGDEGVAEAQERINRVAEQVAALRAAMHSDLFPSTPNH